MKTPLHITCEFGYQSSTLFLIEKGSDLHLKDNKNDFPLDLAVANRHWSLVSKLLEFGAPFQFKSKLRPLDNMGRNFLYQMAQDGNVKALEHYKEHPAFQVQLMLGKIINVILHLAVCNTVCLRRGQPIKKDYEKYHFI